MTPQQMIIAIILVLGVQCSNTCSSSPEQWQECRDDVAMNCDIECTIDEHTNVQCYEHCLDAYCGAAPTRD